LFFLLQFFHHLAFTIAMHHGPGLIDAVFGKSGGIGIIAHEQERLVESLPHKGCQQEYDGDLSEHVN
jgi:hypothetical protein